MIEHGLLDAKVIDGKPGTHPDDYAVRATPLCTEETICLLDHYLEDANS